MIFTTYCPPELIRPLYFERKPVYQSLCDLLAQAAHNTQSGRIHLHVRSKAVEMGQHEITIIIADTGAGFSQDALETIRTGTDGLICLARDLARRLGGDLTIESRLGKGTEINLSFLAYFSNEEPLDIRNFEPPVAPIDMSTKSMMNISLDDNVLEKNNVISPEPQRTQARPSSIAQALKITTEQNERGKDYHTHQSWKAALPEKYEAIIGKNILIVEDSEANRHAIQGLLDPLKPNSVFASNGLHAITAMRSSNF